MKTYEIYFYNNDREMMLDQGSLAIRKGVGGPWKIVHSGEVSKTEKLAFEKCGMQPKKFKVVIENTIPDGPLQELLSKAKQFGL